MIIKNNFNDKDANPLENYQGVGKGSNSLDKRFSQEKEGFVAKNMDNHVIKDILDSDKEFEEDSQKENKWDFFR